MITKLSLGLALGREDGGERCRHPQGRKRYESAVCNVKDANGKWNEHEITSGMTIDTVRATLWNTSRSRLKYTSAARKLMKVTM